MIFSTKTTKRIFVKQGGSSPEQTTGAPVKPLYHSMEQSPQLLIRHTASGIPTGHKNRGHTHKTGKIPLHY